MDAKSIALKIVNIEGLKSVLLDDLLDNIIKSKLEELAQKSENSLDDSLVAMIMPFIRAEAGKYLDELAKSLQEPDAG